MVVGVLTCCALLHSVFDFKATQINIQHSLIQEVMIYVFEHCQNAMEEIKNIYCAQGEGIVNHCCLTSRLKKFFLGYKKLLNQQRSDRPKTMALI